MKTSISKSKSLRYSHYTIIGLCTSKNSQQDEHIAMVERTTFTHTTSNYSNNRLPLLPQHFMKLPVGSIQPEGWLKEYLIRQKNGLTGHLNEISAWLEKRIMRGSLLKAITDGRKFLTG